MHPREINFSNEDEIIDIFNNITWSEQQEIFNLLPVEKVTKIKKLLRQNAFNRNDVGWGETMDNMLRNGHPQYMYSKHSNIEKPKLYKEKGNKRKVFIINEEEF